MKISQEEKATIFLLMNFGNQKFKDTNVATFICKELPGYSKIFQEYQYIYDATIEELRDGGVINKQFFLENNNTTIRETATEMIMIEEETNPDKEKLQSTVEVSVHALLLKWLEGMYCE